MNRLHIKQFQQTQYLKAEWRVFRCCVYAKRRLVAPVTKLGNCDYYRFSWL